MCVCVYIHTTSSHNHYILTNHPIKNMGDFSVLVFQIFKILGFQIFKVVVNFWFICARLILCDTFVQYILSKICWWGGEGSIAPFINKTIATDIHVRVSHQCVFQFVVLCIALPSMPGLAKPSVACSMEKWVTLTRGESLGTMLVLL